MCKQASAKLEALIAAYGRAIEGGDEAALDNLAAAVEEEAEATGYTDHRRLKALHAMAEAALRREQLIWPRTTYSGQPPVAHDNSADIDRHQAGGTVTFHVGAPGYGTRTYRITRIDAEGMWGYLEQDASGELTPGMVR